jgi:hypothetical protein
MEVYRVQEDALDRISERSVEYEQDLQSHLLKASGAKIGEVRMMYISQEGTPDEEGGFFDILGIDENGDTVVVELKRDKTPRLVVSQALEYACGIRREDYDRLDDRFRAFRRSRGEAPDESLREAHAEFFELEDEPLADSEFNNDVHLVVVAGEFADVTLNMADLLRDHELDVVCVRYRTFSDSEDDLTLLTTETVRRPLALEPGGEGSPTSTETEEIQREFWEGLIEKIDQQTGSDLYTESANPRSYLPVRGTLPADADIGLGTDSLRGQIQVKLHLRDDGTEMYDHLVEHKSDIESEIGAELMWDPDSARYEQIRLVRDGNIKTDREQWEEFQNWLIEYWKTFDEVFGDYLRRRS